MSNIAGLIAVGILTVKDRKAADLRGGIVFYRE